MDFELLVSELKKLNSQIGSYAYYILGLKYAQELNDVNIAQLIKTAGLTESMSKEIGKAKKVAELIQSGKYGICFESSSDGNVVLIKNKKENNVQYSKEQIVKILADLYDSDIEKSAVGGIFIFKYGKHVVDKYTPTELMREAHLLNPNVKERYAAELNGAFLMYRYFQNNPTEFDVSCDHNIPELFAAYLKNEGKSEATIDRYVKQVPNNSEVQNIVQSIAGTTALFDVMDVAKLLQISQKVAAQDFDKKGGNMYSAGINAFAHFVSNLNLFQRHIEKGHENKQLVWPKHSVKFPLQTIFYGAPGTGKSHKVKEVTDTLLRSDVFRTTFHPDSDYSTFVGCYKPKMVKAPIRDGSGHEITSACEDEKKRIAYEYEPQAFLKAYVRAYETNDPVFLVIEEINRGNCAQIFGDMFQLLDRNENGESDYAIKPETAIQEFLNEKLEDCDIADEVIKSGEEMRLPANLHIWATMNTSDQSLFPIDSAFKRRWDWKYVPICQGRDKETGSLLKWAIEVGNTKYDWWSFVSKINKEIDDVTHSEDKKLGFFFCKSKENVISAEVFVGKVIFYLWNDVFKDYGFDREIFKDEEGKLTFDKFHTVDASGNVVVVNSKMQKFLDNLGVDFFEDEEDDNFEEGDDSLNEEPSNTTNRFVLDGGEPASLNKIVQNVVLNYATNHPTITAEEIRDVFLAAYKGSGIAHIIETEDEFQSRSNQKSAQRTVSKTVLPNGDTIYVSTQFRAKNPDDNFFKFIEITRKNGWGNIEKE